MRAAHRRCREAYSSFSRLELDALGDAKRLAQSAAILAPFIEPDLLGALVEIPDDLVDKGLTRLVDMEVLARQLAEGPAPVPIRFCLTPFSNRRRAGLLFWALIAACCTRAPQPF